MICSRLNTFIASFARLGKNTVAYLAKATATAANQFVVGAATQIAGAVTVALTIAYDNLSQFAGATGAGIERGIGAAVGRTLGEAVTGGGAGNQG